MSALSVSDLDALHLMPDLLCMASYVKTSLYLEGLCVV